jgi:macrodomain Ter protein organizer (MatP/YcbG family)
VLEGLVCEHRHEDTLQKATADKRDVSKMRVHMDLDRRLWRKFKSSVIDRGCTLTERIQFLVERDLKEYRAESVSA